MGSLNALSKPLPNWIEAVKEEVQSIPSLQQLVSIIAKREVMGPWRLTNGVIIFKERIYLVGESKLISNIVEQFHGSAHEGYQKTFQRIRANFYWKGMRKIIKDYIRSCDTCHRHKVDQTSQIREDISMDFIEGLPPSNGKTTIFVVVDRVSKYAHFISITHPFTTTGIAKVFFDNIFKLQGMPSSIVCDRDPTFTSCFWKELFRLNGTSFNFISSYHPQIDGQTKVVNKTLEMYLRCLTSSQPKEWSRWLSWAEYCYNTNTIQKTPFEVIYGRKPPPLLSYVPSTAKVAVVEEELLDRDKIVMEVINHILKAQNRIKQFYDSKHQEKEFSIGDWIYLKLQPYRQLSVSARKNLKLSARYYGPFEIVQRVGKVAYKLKLPLGSHIHPVFSCIIA